MSHNRRVPTTQDVLRSLAERGLVFRTVIDVGVHFGTPKLMEALPDAHHVLIEPTPVHNNLIRKNYKGFSYELHNVAAGRSDMDAYLVDIAIDGSEGVTHSKVVTDKAEAEGFDNVRAVRDLPIRTLDTLSSQLALSDPVLLKIDVDGHEMDVLAGAEQTLSRVAAVSIEAPRRQLVTRGSFLQEAGFLLCEIVDLDYYRGILWQVDMLFIRADIVADNPSLMPRPGDPAQPYEPAEYVSFDPEFTPKRRLFGRRR